MSWATIVIVLRCPDVCCYVYWAITKLVQGQLNTLDRNINKEKKYALAHFMIPLTTDRYFPDFN